MNGAGNLLQRRVAGHHGIQSALEERRHSVRDGRALDAAVISALENKAFYLRIQPEELGNSEAATIACVSAFDATDWMVQQQWPTIGACLKIEPPHQLRLGRRSSAA